jgi:surface carbohydrate biosynthesis protein
VNIYIIIEHKKRELYSKLLLGFESVLKGNQVYLGNAMPLLQKGLFKPGIVHLKSITPSNSRISEMKFLKKKGFMITSIDEEVGVIQNNTKYVNLRYGNSTINLVDKLFVHGNFDYKNLVTKFPKNKKKIINSGNPRFDFWREDFKNFFKNIYYIKKRNYILFSSNLNNIFTYQKLETNISIQRKAGYFKRGISKKFIESERELSKKFLKKFLWFMNVIGKNFKDLIIIIRPHPTENPLEWREFIGNKKNVEIIGDGNLSDWITYSKCLVHGGCTSGLETVARGKVALSINSKTLKHGEEIPDIVSQKVQNENQIIKKISSIIKNKSNVSIFKHKKFIKNRVINISNKPAYIKINETWENIGNKKLSSQNANLLLKINFFSKSLVKSCIGIPYRNHKFKKFSKPEIKEFKKRIIKINSKFEDIKFEIIKDDLIRLYR